MCFEHKFDNTSLKRQQRRSDASSQFESLAWNQHAIAAPALVRLTRPPLTSTASRRHRRGAVIVPNAALYPRDDDADGKKDGNKRAKRRTWGQAIGVLAVPLGIHALITPDAAHAAGGWYNDVQLGPRSDGGFIGGGASGGAGDATPAFGYEDRGDDYGAFIFNACIGN